MAENSDRGISNYGSRHNHRRLGQSIKSCAPKRNKCEDNVICNLQTTVSIFGIDILVDSKEEAINVSKELIKNAKIIMHLIEVEKNLKKLTPQRFKTFAKKFKYLHCYSCRNMGNCPVCENLF
ncbi:MAG: hypothetical protein WCQ49_01630 [Candidatus Saccharibacteria bacterium]